MTEEEIRMRRRYVDYIKEIAETFDELCNDYTLTERNASEFRQAIVELLFNPIYDIDKSRVVAQAVRIAILDESKSVRVMSLMLECSRVRRKLEEDGKAMFERVKGAGDKRAREFQTAKRLTVTGIKHLCNQCDWLNDEFTEMVGCELLGIEFEGDAHFAECALNMEG